jgi:hypothetical protein
MDKQPQNDPNAALRWSIYSILMCVGLGAMVGRILAVDSVDYRRLADAKFKDELSKRRKELLERQPGMTAVEADYAMLRIETDEAVRHGIWRPFLSANDRSRWCTVRALVEPEMRVPDAVWWTWSASDPRPSVYAIDKVIERDPVTHQFLHPGWDTIDMVQHGGHSYSSKPPLLSTLMAAEYWPIYHLSGWTLGDHPYEIGRFMLITINGASLLLFFLFTARLVERLGTTDWGRLLVMAGCVFGTFLTTFAITITNHLPAAACAAVTMDALVRIWFDGDRRVWTFLSAGFFAAMLVAMEVPAGALAAAMTAIVFWLAPRKTLAWFLPPALLVTVAFFATNWSAVHSLKPAQMHRTGDDNWYDFPKSYWNNRQGIDQAEKSPSVYTLHVLVGHHGIVSLTPMWLLSLLGAGLWMYRGETRLRLLTLLGLGVTMICLAFYVWWPGVDRNYGGNASAFRWVFWLAPLWLMIIAPAADLMSHRRWSRGLGLLLLALSALSASYPTWNPWTPPWIMNFLGYLGRL